MNSCTGSHPPPLYGSYRRNVPFARVISGFVQRQLALLWGIDAGWAPDAHCRKGFRFPGCHIASFVSGCPNLSCCLTRDDIPLRFLGSPPPLPCRLTAIHLSGIPMDLCRSQEGPCHAAAGLLRQVFQLAPALHRCGTNISGHCLFPTLPRSPPGVCPGGLLELLFYLTRATGYPPR